MNMLQKSEYHATMIELGVLGAIAVNKLNFCKKKKTSNNLFSKKRNGLHHYQIEVYLILVSEIN